MGNNGYQNEGMTDHEENINWDEVGAVIPLGEYDVEVVDASYKPTSAGKHMIVCQLRIVSAYDSDNESSVDKMLFENFVFTQSAAFRVKRFAKVSGVDLPSPVNKSILEEWAQAIVGSQVGVAVVHRVWQDEPKATISKFFEFGTGGDAEEKKKVVSPDSKNEDSNDEDEEEDNENKEDDNESDEEVAEKKDKVTSIKEALSKKSSAKKSSAR